MTTLPETLSADELLRFAQQQGFRVTFRQTEAGWVGELAQITTTPRNNFDECRDDVLRWIALYPQYVPCRDLADGLRWLFDKKSAGIATDDAVGGLVFKFVNKGVEYRHATRTADVARGIGVLQWLYAIPGNVKKAVG